MTEDNIPAFPESVTLMIRMANGKDDIDLSVSSVQAVSVPTVLFILETLKQDLIASSATIIEGDFYGGEDD